MARFNSEGISVLHTKSGRGRKPIIVASEDREQIPAAIKSNRQRLQTAKAEWEAQSGKKVSRINRKCIERSGSDNAIGNIRSQVTINNNFPENIVETIMKNQEQIAQLIELQNRLIENLLAKN
ncbi:hypothetical protein FACS189413_18730 [Bacteroidia bacterium]|nr:hypothetical protein FACS189413_18730 [Bacteroidia bacterium]